MIVGIPGEALNSIRMDVSSRLGRVELRLMVEDFAVASSRDLPTFRRHLLIETSHCLTATGESGKDMQN